MKLPAILANLSLSLASVLVMAAMAEAALRFAPVNEGFNFLDVDAANPVFRAAPDQDVVSSQHWDFYGARTLHVNNAGFRNDQDYVAPDGRPRIAVVGDSYVEAVQVAYEDAFFGRLQAALDRTADVYSFGFSGAPLSQYLIWARHARAAFANDHLAIAVIGNDFDESLAWYKQGPGFHHYARCEGGGLCLKLVEFHRGTLATLAKHSALVRYLFYNMKIVPWAQYLWRNAFASPAAAATPSYMENVDAVITEERLADSRLAVDRFLADLPVFSGLPPDRVVFVVDGRVYDDPGNAHAESYFWLMRRYFIGRARGLGFDVIDMQPIFTASYKADGERFESDRDGHWNEHGHAVVGAALIQYYEARLGR